MVLPVQKEIPKYWDRRSFIFVVVAVSIINSMYFSLFIFLWNEYGPRPPIPLIYTSYPLVLPAIGFVVAMLGCGWLYKYLASIREKGYLFRNSNIGIDIDGVLNAHREHFCKIHRNNGGTSIAPDSLNKLPVHHCKHLNLTEKDEYKVFNRIDYWTKMPIFPGVDEVLAEINKKSSPNFHIFTNRPWPLFPSEHFSSEEKAKIKNDWSKEDNRKLLDKLCGRSQMYMLTKDWLDGKRIKFACLYIERKSSDERIRLAKKNRIRFFVEDNPENAIKLSEVCELVFLIKHPYNLEFINDLPDNVLPVDDWHELHSHIKPLL